VFHEPLERYSSRQTYNFDVIYFQIIELYVANNNYLSIKKIDKVIAKK